MTTTLFTFPDTNVVSHGGSSSKMAFNAGSPQPRFNIAVPVTLNNGDQVRFYGSMSNFGSFSGNVNASVPGGVLGALGNADGAFDLTLTAADTGTGVLVISSSTCPVNIDTLTIEKL